jgi:hypothetical protein
MVVAWQKAPSAHSSRVPMQGSPTFLRVAQLRLPSQKAPGPQSPSWLQVSPSALKRVQTLVVTSQYRPSATRHR